VPGQDTGRMASAYASRKEPFRRLHPRPKARGVEATKIQDPNSLQILLGLLETACVGPPL
jgi:hypothetical protein